jgi:copper chaperone CopZ
VESVTPDMAAGKVVVTGPADAVELKERIEARAKKSVQIVSAGAGPPKKDKEKETKADGGEKKADKEKGGDGGEKKADKEKGGGGEKKAEKEKGGGGGEKKGDKEKGADKPKEEKKPKEVSYLPIIIRLRWGGDPRHRLPPWSATERLSLPAFFQETVTLKIRLHCDGCIDRIKRRISKIKGEVFPSYPPASHPIPSQANRQKAVSLFVEI